MPVNIKELIDNGYIVICDTNVYLHIYRFSPEFSDFALRCMQAIQSGIIMPSTVRYEFLKHYRGYFSKNRNSRPAFSPAFSSCVPGFSDGFLRPCRRRSSRLDAPRAKTPFRRPHRPAVPGRCLPLSAPLEAPGQGAGQPHGSNGSTPLSSTCAAYNRHSPEEGTGRFPCHSWHTSP